MRANVRTAVGPELALVEHHTSPALRNAALLAVLRDEYGGDSAGWLLTREPTHSGDRPLRPSRGPSLWDRLLGRQRAPGSVRGTRTLTEGSDGLEIVRTGPAGSAEGIRGLRSHH